MASSTWLELIETEKTKPYWHALQRFLEEERLTHRVYPPEHLVFQALHLTLLSNVKVVILGQDPYHGPGQATGLAFSVAEGITLPPSLRNIFTELQNDVGSAIPEHGDLSQWAEQGVLLLNTTLTVRDGDAGSHAGHGWEQFTDAVIRKVNDLPERVVFLLWGANAHKKRALISHPAHVVHESPHPSPLSAYRGFFCSRPFSTANTALQGAYRSPIDWNL
jgi:uracil-DNA glycosylase